MNECWFSGSGKSNETVVMEMARDMNFRLPDRVETADEGEEDPGAVHKPGHIPKLPGSIAGLARFVGRFNANQSLLLANKELQHSKWHEFLSTNKLISLKLLLMVEQYNWFFKCIKQDPLNNYAILQFCI